jgi:hypothetical protein
MSDAPRNGRAVFLSKGDPERAYEELLALIEEDGRGDPAATEEPGTATHG